METLQQIDSFLEMMDRPAFFVEDGIITKINQIAKNRSIKLGTPIAKMLPKLNPEYDSFTQGCLHLTVFIKRLSCRASVTRYSNGDIFLLERNFDRIQLQTMALSAQQLRVPLANMVTMAEELIPKLAESEDPEIRFQATHLNKGLYQIIRLVSNMADAERYYAADAPELESTSVPVFFNHLMERLTVIAEAAGRQINYTPYPTRRFGLVNREMLERAVYNIVSNAIKFSDASSPIDASVTIDGDRLRFTVRDYGTGIPNQAWGTLYSRYQREPSAEDSRFGIGLGMTLIHTAAAAHGGTVLVDQPEGSGTRVTMTIRISNAPANMLRTPTMRISSYSGEMDNAMVEFSEILPAELFDGNH